MPRILWLLSRLPSWEWAFPGLPIISSTELQNENTNEDTLESEISKLTQSVLYLSRRVSERDSSALHEVKSSLDTITKHASATHTFKLQIAILQLLLNLEAKEQRIEVLREEILRLSDSRLEATHDDQYFATKMGGVFRIVEEWVYLTYIDTPGIQQLQQLEPGMEISFREVAGDRWREFLTEEHVLLFTSAVTKILVSKVLEPPLLGIKNDCLALMIPAIEESLQEDSNENMKWRTKTIDSLTRNQLFWDNFESTAHTLAANIFTMFAIFTKKKPIVRIKKLTSLIKDAGLVAVECQKQPSKFQFIWFPPGHLYEETDVKMISDTSGRFRDQDLKDKKRVWVVLMTVAPALLRIEYGTSKKEVVVLKARVLLEERSPANWEDETSQETSSRVEENDDGSSVEEENAHEGGIGNGNGDESSGEESAFEKRGEAKLSMQG